MKTRPIVAARIEHQAGLPPRAADYDDIYHPQVGAFVQARHVFLGGNRLPARWQDRDHFTVLETGFGLGNNFLATWQAWRNDAQRCRQLHYVAIDLHPPTQADLRRAHAGSEGVDLAARLADAWPALTPNLHPIDFEGGAVRLLLAFGDVGDLLPELVCRADAFYLDGFAPARNPRMWDTRVLKALARHAAPQATAATWSVAREVRDGLGVCGFDVSLAPGTGGKREITLATWAPRFTPREAAPRTPPLQSRDAVIIGAGLAGASTAAALAALGWQVTVLDRHREPAGETSGNRAGLFHGTVHPDDGVHARLFRAAALQAQRELQLAIDEHGVPGEVNGLLRLERQLDIPAMRQLIERQGLPDGYVQACDRDTASRLAGVPLADPAWFYPGGGWISPGQLARHWLARPGVHFVGGVEVISIRATGSTWRCHDAHGRCIAEGGALVLANAADADRLLSPLQPPGWTHRLTRGQVSGWSDPTAAPPGLLRPVAGDGYALPLQPDAMLCGATQSDRQDPDLCRDDHLSNFARLRRLTGIEAPADESLWRGRVGWRLQAADRLPLVGALPAWPLDGRQRLDQVRLVPRTPGLFMATALGGRGITLAPLAGRLLAARITGTALPLEQSLADAIDPVRWLVRVVRKSSGPADVA